MQAPDFGAVADLAILREAAAEAGRIAMRYFGKKPEVWMKGGTSPVSEADYAADHYLRETLLLARPGYGWLSEETQERVFGTTSQRSFIVDPIDGTRGFLEGNPQWCVSVAIVENGSPMAGVLECPATGETFEAARGLGARRNGSPISIGAQREFTRSVGGPRAMIDLLPQAWKGRVRPFRYVPSLAYRIAMIADGRLDATFVKPNAHDWDIAAALLILQESGGHILNARHAPPLLGNEDSRHPALAAGSGQLLEAMVDVLSEYR
ncbi:MAG: inositol monophosphatase [Rhizobiaceae bacterium]|nr:inositol monophosphatase [Rhizobiaceae bacterium]